jgi:hypothetical protein
MKKYWVIAALSALVLLTGTLAVLYWSNLKLRIAWRLGVPASSLLIGQMPLEGLRGCEIYDVVDSRFPGSPVANFGFARLKDGSLINGIDKSTLEKVLSHCATENTPAKTLGVLIGYFSEYRGWFPLEDDSSAYTQQLLQKAGMKFFPPEVVQNQDARTLRYLSLGHDGYELMLIEARTQGKTITVNGKLLAKRRGG